MTAHGSADALELLPLPNHCRAPGGEYARNG